jgi:hypothetical protein
VHSAELDGGSKEMKVLKRLCSLLLAVALVFTLVGCKEAATSLARKVMGVSSDAEEADTTRWAELTSDEIVLPDSMDSTAKYTTAQGENGDMYFVFNGIWSRETSYFTAPNGSLTITATGSAEGVQRFKVAVWTRTNGATQYVDGSTGYIKTDGNTYTYTVDGLDPEATYRLTISYDSSRYYLYGIVRVDGIG